MQIVELGDCSMVIMKDSEDPPWVSVGNIYRRAIKYNDTILVDKGDQLTYHYLESSDYIYTAGRLILFFKDAIPDRFQLHDKVFLTTNNI
jgi:hypothetical protein